MFVCLQKDVFGCLWEWGICCRGLGDRRVARNFCSGEGEGGILQRARIGERWDWSEEGMGRGEAGAL